MQELAKFEWPNIKFELLLILKKILRNIKEVST